MVSVSVSYLFYRPVDEKVKTWPLTYFRAKENPNKEPLFDWPIALQYDANAKYWLISRKFLGMKLFDHATRVCIHSINQSNRSICVRLLFLFCSRVFISRSYENRSNPHCLLTGLLFTFLVYLIYWQTVESFYNELCGSGPGACFSKVPVNFRSRKTVLCFLCLHSRSIKVSIILKIIQWNYHLTKQNWLVCGLGTVQLFNRFGC